MSEVESCPWVWWTIPGWGGGYFEDHGQFYVLLGGEGGNEVEGLEDEAEVVESES